jgi:hypothetical protein
VRTYTWRRISTGVLLVGWALAPGSMARASCPMGGNTACEEFQRADLVFFGEVSDVDWEPRAQVDASGPKVRFSIIEGFKGDPPQDLTLSVSRSSEEARFEFGRRAVFYLRRTGTNWTSACGRIHDAADVDDLEVSWLRNLKNNAPGGQVFGSVVDTANGNLFDLGQIRVGLLYDGTRIAETRTEVGGRFDLGWRPPGTYVLQIAPSESLAGASQEIIVTAASTCARISPVTLQPR